MAAECRRGTAVALSFVAAKPEPQRSGGSVAGAQCGVVECGVSSALSHVLKPGNLAPLWKLLSTQIKWENTLEALPARTMSISQLSHLIDLPEPDLQQVLDYASTLSKAEAAEHFKNLLGDSPQAFQFVSDFNSRRLEPKSTAAAPKTSQPTEINAVPKPQRAPKKKAPLGTPAPRKVESFGPALGTVYNK